MAGRSNNMAPNITDAANIMSKLNEVTNKHQISYQKIEAHADTLAQISIISHHIKGLQSPHKEMFEDSLEDMSKLYLFLIDLAGVFDNDGE